MKYADFLLLIQKIWQKVEKYLLTPLKNSSFYSKINALSYGVMVVADPRAIKSKQFAKKRKHKRC